MFCAVYLAYCWTGVETISLQCLWHPILANRMEEIYCSFWSFGPVHKSRLVAGRTSYPGLVLNSFLSWKFRFLETNISHKIWLKERFPNKLYFATKQGVNKPCKKSFFEKEFNPSKRGFPWAVRAAPWDFPQTSLLSNPPKQPC